MKPAHPALLAFALCMSTPVQGQALPEPAAAVADSFLSRIARKDFVGATDLVDSASMEVFRTSSIRSARLNDSLARTVQRRRTDVPPAVADWMESQARIGRDAYGSFFEREFGVPTRAELERLTAKEMFARWLAARHPEAQLERARTSHPRARELPPIVLRPTSPSVLGTVAASDSLAYALIRNGLGAAVRPLPSVLPVRLTPAGWRIPADEVEIALINEMTCSLDFVVMEADEVF